VLPVDMSPVVVAVVIADEGAGGGAVRRETPDGLFAVGGDAPASGTEARLGGPFLVRSARLVASLAEPHRRAAAPIDRLEMESDWVLTVRSPGFVRAGW
jgi:hypothetical protein